MKYDKFKYKSPFQTILKDDTNYQLEDFARKIRHERATIRVGKNGITEGIINEVKKKIEKDRAVKVQILKNCPEDVLSILKQIEEKSESKLWRKAGKAGIFIKNE